MFLWALSDHLRVLPYKIARCRDRVRPDVNPVDPNQPLSLSADKQWPHTTTCMICIHQNDPNTTASIAPARFV